MQADKHTAIDDKSIQVINAYSPQYTGNPIAVGKRNEKFNSEQNYTGYCSAIPIIYLEQIFLS